VDTVRRKKFLLLLAGTASVAAAIWYVLRASLAERMPAGRRFPGGTAHERADALWSFERRPGGVTAGRRLRIQAPAPAVVHWSTDQWDTVHDTPATRLRNGVYVVDLPTENLPPGTRVLFTFYWPDAKRWEGQDFQLTVEPASSSSAPV
jgi:hypothetical protein